MSGERLMNGGISSSELGMKAPAGAELGGKKTPYFKDRFKGDLTTNSRENMARAGTPGGGGGSTPLGKPGSSPDHKKNYIPLTLEEITARDRILQTDEERERRIAREAAERRDPYTGKTDAEILAMPWDKVQGYQELPHKDGYIVVMLEDAMQRQYWVYWPTDAKESENKVRELLARAELARVNINENPALNSEIQRVRFILSVISSERDKREQEGIIPELGQGYGIVPLRGEETKDLLEANKQLLDQFRARISFINSFILYEQKSDNGIVIEQARNLYDPEYLNSLFAIDEFVEALQYYEDNGFRFAEHNSNELRPIFGKEVQMHLAHIEAVKQGLTPETEEYNQYIDNNYKKNTWAQFLAERFFRFTGRACSYDHLVINKGQPNQRRVTWQYNGPESVDWASGGGGCDYEMRKHERMRDFLRYEGANNRAYIPLIDGIDHYGGDLFSRTIASNRPGSKLTILEDKKNEQPPIVASNQQELDDMQFLTYKVSRVRTYKTETKRYEWTERFVEADRNTDDNAGERVGRLNFKLIRKTGYTFTKMDDTPMGLWTTRFIEGPDKFRKALAEYMDNPTAENLLKMKPATDYEKGRTSEADLAEVRTHNWQTRERMVRNYLHYCKYDRFKATGRENFDDERIQAEANKLAGLTNDKDPAFIGIPEWLRIMREELKINIPEEYKEEELRKLPETERRQKALELVKKTRDQIQLSLEKKLGKKFSLWFILGFFQGLAKATLEQLGIK